MLIAEDVSRKKQRIKVDSERLSAKGGKMYISILNGVVIEIDYFRKAYRKSRWKRTAQRTIRRTLTYKPYYWGTILIL